MHADEQKAYGVFKPVGHVIVSFAPDADVQAALSSLIASGFASTDVTLYTPERMKDQADADIADAGLLASVGQELNLVKAHRELAEKGCSFLVVRAPNDDAAATIARIAGRFNAERALRYGHLIVEELIPVGTSDRQVFESPDRGLDAQTRSGVEGEAIDKRKLAAGRR